MNYDNEHNINLDKSGIDLEKLDQNIKNILTEGNIKKK